eukprot:Gregarina_sp_Pseudo_9__600@NODE_1383_length_1645_cov_78_785803_g1289_i0_p1_GENE_NODE_1383_length_1645_cov_78_785803_g1289_i0NODE_1383_length_1645_cov_78_785803_g1289_i0_p1_ORF_typecomplete_len468_score34_90PP2C/PF00481_21/2e39PP2C_2/PF13672_6/2_7e09SpoIIE/PF07228_12/2_4e03SpoIIE/PF07228_12/0_0043_NODE_1383_length_1645_cov_78_785803_g1289_i01401543
MSHLCDVPAAPGLPPAAQQPEVPAAGSGSAAGNTGGSLPSDEAEEYSSTTVATLPDKRTVSVPPKSALACPSPSNPFLCPFYRVVTDGSRRAARVRVDRSSSLISEEFDLGEVIHGPLSMQRYLIGEISIFTDIGGRKAQEDRLTFCPALRARPDCCLVGVFDGTVGDFASDHVKDYVVPHLLSSHSWGKVVRILEQRDRERPLLSSDGAKLSSIDSAKIAGDSICDEQMTSHMFPALADALDEMYLWSDSELVAQCAAAKQHYASSTSVVAVIAGGCCGIGHLGDSRAALGHFGDNQVYANFITDDHKPNQFYERSRIKASGGSVEYLHNHNNKPFIRGGDFTARKHKGEQPMQLQYSRAFGGKDLKSYGLSNEPDILCFRIEQFHSCLILASDGLWDVMSAPASVRLAVRSRMAGQDPAKALVQTVLEEQSSRKQVSDNITAIVLFFNTAGNDRVWSSSSTVRDL